MYNVIQVGDWLFCHTDYIMLITWFGIRNAYGADFCGLSNWVMVLVFGCGAVCHVVK